jgi:uncharacterized membrane protein YdjX (TVP38/TMEM64 family)
MKNQKIVKKNSSKKALLSQKFQKIDKKILTKNKPVKNPTMLNVKSSTQNNVQIHIEQKTKFQSENITQKPKNLIEQIKYPKLMLLGLTIIIAIYIFQFLATDAIFHEKIAGFGYAGTLLSGMFYAFGFTAAPATAVLLVQAKSQEVLYASIVAGLGALISDILIFLFVRYSIFDELKKLKKEQFMQNVIQTEKEIFGKTYKLISPIFAGFLIASPLPTEIGVGMLANFKKISTKQFIMIAYLLHTAGIFIILSIGTFG